MEVCEVCGLPKELCVCQEIAKEAQRIIVYTTKRKFGRVVTIIEGIDERDVDLKKLAKELKTKLACGGTVKEGRIELQGDHRARVKDILVNLGFPKDIIEIK